MPKMDKNDLFVFFRNDDVRNSIDETLVSFTNVFLESEVPISHSVEPGNLADEVVNWLISLHTKTPELIEITQHGYNHNLANSHQKYEFGMDRDYISQYQDIQKGYQIMNKQFGAAWSNIFTFPYGTYNEHTLKALDQLDYKAISSKIQFNLLSRTKNTLGRLLQSDLILGKGISYHPGIRHSYKFKEFSVSVNFIKRYAGESKAEHYSFEDIKKQIEDARKFTNVIGVLFHHRYHYQQLNLVEKVILHLKESGARFSKISDLI